VKNKIYEDAAFLGSILFLLELYFWFDDCRGHLLEKKSSLILVNK